MKVDALKKRQEDDEKPLSDNEKRLLERIAKAQEQLLCNKAKTEDTVDEIETTERTMRDMHFQDTHQVKREIEEAKRDYMSQKRQFEEVMSKKQEIYTKIDLFKQRFHEQRRQTRKNQEKSARIEKEVNLVIE